MRYVPAWVVIVCLWGVSATAAVPEFAHDIRPLFEKHCYACHAGEQAKSGLRLDLKAAAFKGGGRLGDGDRARRRRREPACAVRPRR